jgi:hypothetical protein
MSETSVEDKQLATAEELSAKSRPDAFSRRLNLAGSRKISARYAVAGALLLALVCAAWIYWNWATWGDLSADAGREIYVSVVIKDGGTLYRDVWYPFGPISPYVNAKLFRIFGVHIFVPYAVGIVSALASAVFIFLAGIELGFPLASWATGAVVVLQALEPGWSSFPLPYSSAAVYACLFSCAFLWMLLRGLIAGGWLWSVSLGILAAMALLSKPEFGLACFPVLFAAILYRGMYQRSWKRVATDLAGTLPGIAVCAAVFGWMISLRGWTFITQENILMWPTSYFMKTFGREWLAATGFDLSWPAIRGAMVRSMLPLGWWIIVVRMASHCRGKNSLKSIALTAAIVAGLVAYWMHFAAVPSLILFLVAVFFPMPMVLYIALAALAAGWYLFRNPREPRIARLFLLAGFSELLAFRILFKAVPEGYPVFYDPSVVLGYLIVLSLLLRTEPEKSSAKFRLDHLAMAGCLAAVLIVTAAPRGAKAQLVPVQTDFGTLRAGRRTAKTLEAAIAFLKEKNSRRESVMMLPEDTMLYVLSGTRAPTRVNAFVPGILVPGAMTEELFREIDCKPVQYLLWSNRTFSEYGVPVFGLDFNQELARFLTSRYRPMGLLVPEIRANAGLTFMIWQREDTSVAPACPGPMRGQ